MGVGSLKQTSFSGGSLSDQILSRSDQSKYTSGLRLCRNAIIQRFGSLQSRGGTIYRDTENYKSNGIPWDAATTFLKGNTVSYLGTDYVALQTSTNITPNVSPTYWQAIGTTAAVRIVKFVFDYNNSYELIFSVNNIRIYKNGAQVTVPLASIAAYSAITSYLIGQMVTYLGSVYICRAPNTASFPTLVPQYWEAMTAVSGSYPLDIPVNYTTGTTGLNLPQASLSVLQAVNFNDVMTVTSQYFRPFQLTRYGDTDWRVTPFAIGANLAPPSPVIATPGVGAGTSAIAPNQTSAGGVGDPVEPATYWVITSYNASGQSVKSNVYATVPPHGASVGFPITLTWGAVGGSPLGYGIYRGLAPAGPFGLIGVTSGLSWIDDGTVGRAYPAIQPPVAGTGSTVFVYEVTSVSAVDGSESLPSATASCTGGSPTDANPNVISWPLVAGASSYNVYRIINGIPGIIGTTTLNTLNDTNIQPDYSQQPPVYLTNADGSELFTTEGNWPATCCFFQQRLCLANTVNAPTSVWMSRVGSFSNFSVSTPIRDTDAILFVVAGKAAQPIIAMVDLQKFIIHTASAEYAATGNQYGTITPTAINLVLQGSCGASLPAPVTLGNTDLYVQSRGTQLRDLRFEIGSYTYTGKDLAVFSTQMFQGLTIVDMDWQQIKDSIVWCVMSNGTMYGMTYVPEQEVWAWHQHTTTNGFIENVCVVPNAGADVVYLIVRRVINGVTVRYFEEMSDRDFSDTVFLTDFIGTDASLTYDGTVTDGSTITATTSGGWTTADLLTLTASTARFSAADVTNGNQVVASVIDATTGLVTDRVTFSILAYVSPTQVRGYAQRTVPIWARVAVSTWGIAKRVFTGATHLRGQNISILADGNVAANPQTAAYPIITVDATGGFTVTEPSLVLTAGLPIRMDAQTMPCENATGETISNKHVTVKECCPIFYNSRGGLFGQDFQHLNAWVEPRSQPPPAGSTYGYPVAPYTGPARIPIRGTPQLTGQICVSVLDPLPFAMSGIVATIETGGG